MVPCPQCGWLQKNMVRTSTLVRASQVFLGLAVVSLGIGLTTSNWTYGGAGLGVSTIIGLLTTFLYNPNSKFDPQTAAQNAKHSSGIALPELDQGQGLTDEALQRELFSCLRKAMLSMAGIDGEIHPSEMMAISRLYLEHTDERVDTATLEHEAKLAMGQHDRMLNGLYCLAPYMIDDDKTKFLKAAAVIAAADGRIDPAETQLMKQLAETLEVPAVEVNCIMSGLSVPSRS